jgi:Xaa-Pro aminopeptidase
VSAATTHLEEERITKVATLAERAGIGEVIICDPPTMRWLGVADPGGSWLQISDGSGRIVPATSAETGAEGDGSPQGSPRIWFAGRAGARDARFTELTAAIAAVRAVKDPGELLRIRAAAELVEAGHRGLREALEPGVSELELWAAAARQIEAAGGAGDRAGVDLMVGARTALIGEPPSDARLADGDPVLFDLAPERDGYWADSCATLVCGAPSPALADRLAVIESALQCGLAAARPGVSVGEVDAAIRERLAAAGLRCPHHTGHGVGVCAQELPWFVPGNNVVLECGMVVALEPGAYSDGFGVRLEHLAVIDAGGATPLTKHPLTLIPERR